MILKAALHNPQGGFAQNDANFSLSCSYYTPL